MQSGALNGSAAAISYTLYVYAERLPKRDKSLVLSLLSVSLTALNAVVAASFFAKWIR
jgi:hypothetical protein